MRKVDYDSSFEIYLVINKLPKPHFLGKWLQKIFPPLVTAITVTLIGVALTGTGMKYWGGGVVCAEVSEKNR